MGGLPDPDWYFDNVLIGAVPGNAGAPSPTREWQRWWQARAGAPDPVLRLAAAQGFVVTAGQLADLGVPRHVVRAELRRGRWYSPIRGVVAPVVVGLDDSLRTRRRRHTVDATGMALARRGQVISGASAAIVHGLPTLSVPPRPELTARAEVGLGRRQHVSVRGATLTDADVGSWFGAPVTTVARTLVDLARHSRRNAVMAYDAALAERLVEPADVGAAVDRARGWPGVRQAREVMALATPLSESPLESLTRLALHDDGFPVPVLQACIAGTAYRVDFYWPDRRLVLEADGRTKYTGDELWREKRRDDELRRRGLWVERVTWSEVVTSWRTTARRLRPYFVP